MRKILKLNSHLWKTIEKGFLLIFKPGEIGLKSLLKTSFRSPFGFLSPLKIVFLFLLFSHLSSATEIDGCKSTEGRQLRLTDNDFNNQCLKEEADAQRRWRIEDDRREEADERARRNEDERKRKEEARERNNALKEQQRIVKENRREAKENRKELEQKCEQAEQDAKEALEESQDKQADLQEEFYDLEEKVTDLEKQNTEGQERINQALEDLKKASNQNIQNLKDEMGRELKGIEGEIGNLENALSQLYDAVEEAEEQRLTAFYARRKQENELYSACFSTALKQTEDEKLRFYKRKKSGALQKKHIGALVQGGKAQVRGTFSGRFNYFLNLCLNNQAALLKKKNHANEYKLMLEKLKRKEMRIEDKIADVQITINHLKTSGKQEVLKKYKEKMAMDIKNFEQAYSSLTQNHQRNTAQIIQEVGKIKQQQATVLMNRAKAIPQQTRNQLVENQCQGLDMLNMFPSTPTIPTLPYAPGSGELFQLGGGGVQ